MDIGAEFDDDFFEKPKVKKESTPQNYEAKICVPLWFMDTKVAKADNSERLLALKHQADYHYYCKKYSKAAEIYEKCLKLVPASNNTWKREFMENLARSFLHTNELQKALEWSLKLDRNSLNLDQKIISMNLLAVVCHRLGKYKEELEALHQCMSGPHMSCPEIWMRLGLCYAGLYNFNLPDYHLPQMQNSEQELVECCAFKSRMNSVVEGEVAQQSDSSAITWSGGPKGAEPDVSSMSAPCDQVPYKCDICTNGTLVVSSCMIRTKMLIDSGGPNLLDRERDERIKRKIENSLRHMEIEQQFIDLASQSLGASFLAQLQVCDNTIESEKELTRSGSDREVPQHV